MELSDQKAKRRLLQIMALCGLMWGVLWLIQSMPQQQEELSLKYDQIPSISTWKRLEIYWPQQESVSLKKVHDQSHHNAHKAQGTTHHLWTVQSSDDKKEGRAIDPVLAQRLSEEFSEVHIVERRVIKGVEEARQLGLTRAALKLMIYSQDKDARSSLLQLRVGAEHMRHSTWVRALSAEGTPLETAWRVNRRLRRAIAHRPEKWSDRRLGVLQEGRLNLITCFQGRHDIPLHQRRQQWSIKRINEDEWRVVTQGEPPALDQAVVNSFAYTLRTLKASKYLNIKRMSADWRPHYSCSWESIHGEQGWVSLGQVLQQRIHPRQNLQRPLKDSLIHVVEGERGIGQIPDHIAHFLTPRLSQLLSRSISMVDPSLFIGIKYTPPPTPLQSLSSSRSVSWTAEKRSTGWWLNTSRHGRHIKSPLRQQALSQWLSLFTQSSASVEYLPHVNLKHSAMGATITLTTTAGGCSSLQEPQVTVEGCTFTLVEQSTSDQLSSSTQKWLRSRDHVSFKLSRAHHDRLVRGPLF